jgi:hypothetical protein
MTLDVTPPDPPELEAQLDVAEYDDVDVDVDEYRREELERFLHEGAWERAFGEWTERTDMDERTFEVVTDLDLFARFDFFWDDFADRVGYHAPGIPEDWRQREIHPGLDSWGTVSTINAELTEFGQTVCDVLKSEYIDWGADYEPPDELPDFDE